MTAVALNLLAAVVNGALWHYGNHRPINLWVCGFSTGVAAMLLVVRIIHGR